MIKIFSVIIVCGIVAYISDSFADMMQNNMDRRVASSRVYEQWLLTKASAEVFLTSNKKPELKTNVYNNIKVLDKIFSNLEEESSDDRFINSHMMRNRISSLLGKWHYVKYYLIEMVSNEGNYRNFETQIFWLFNDANSFDNELKDITEYLDRFHSMQLQMLWAGFLFIAMLCVIITASLIFYFNKMNKAKLAEQEYKKLLAESMVNRENEKRDMVLEIHDTVIQDMVFSKMLCLDLLNQQSQQDNHEDLQALTNRIVSALKQIRDISYGIRPPEMDKKLDEILSAYVVNWETKSGRSAVYNSLGLDTVKINNSLKLNIYRIVQELLTNIEKHSSAKNVKISIIVSWPSLILKVSDDGAGFDFGKAMEISDGKSHSGLRGMMERVKISRGVIKIKSLQDKGTSVSITFPLEAMDE